MLSPSFHVGLPCIDLKLKLEYIISFLLLRPTHSQTTFSFVSDSYCSTAVLSVSSHVNELGE